jgi:hypothetical protein
MIEEAHQRRAWRFQPSRATARAGDLSGGAAVCESLLVGSNVWGRAAELVALDGLLEAASEARG